MVFKAVFPIDCQPFNQVVARQIKERLQSQTSGRIYWRGIQENKPTLYVHTRDSQWVKNTLQEFSGYWKFSQ